MSSELRRAWQRSDRLFGMLADDAWLAQPIPLRQPFVFYLGHLPAFAWNHIGRRRLGRDPFEPELDLLFERGIDPVGVDQYVPAAEWPPLERIYTYRDQVRQRLIDEIPEQPSPAERAVLDMVVEHELMHHETLLYMFQELPHESKRRPADWPALPTPASPPPVARAVGVPAGDAVLGQPADRPSFAWDNERPARRIAVDAFRIDDRPVTNAELLELVSAGGYHDRRLWRDEDWEWRSRRGLEHPHGWIKDGASFRVRSLFEDVPFSVAAYWPAAVSWAEAAAYARWKDTRLPTEAELARAGAPGRESDSAWSPDEPAEPGIDGNFGFTSGSPLPVGAHRARTSARGVEELLGNGWEWTSTVFAPFPGFEPMAGYPGYSADFFDGRHFVMKGASWATDARLTRASFRNWFQPHYPYVFSKFRLIR